MLTIAGGILLAVFIVAMLRRLPQVIAILFILYLIGSASVTIIPRLEVTHENQHQRPAEDRSRVTAG